MTQNNIYQYTTTQKEKNTIQRTTSHHITSQLDIKQRLSIKYNTIQHITTQHIIAQNNTTH